MPPWALHALAPVHLFACCGIESEEYYMIFHLPACTWCRALLSGMSWGSLGWTLALFWLGIHGLHRLYGRFITNTRISLYFLQARVETRRWNSVHGSLLSRLKRSTLRSWLDDMYGLGFVVCTLTMSVVLPLLLWTSWTLFKSLTIPKAPRLVRREATLTPIVSM